jgi:hypothetical protein
MVQQMARPARPLAKSHAYAGMQQNGICGIGVNLDLSYDKFFSTLR